MVRPRWTSPKRPWGRTMRESRRPSWRSLRAGAICAAASLLLALLIAPTPARTAITPATVSRLENRWSITAPVVRFADARQGPPVVAGDKLYLSDPRGVGAYNAVTGARL